LSIAAGTEHRHDTILELKKTAVARGAYVQDVWAMCPR
jgi:hypothetical protein